LRVYSVHGDPPREQAGPEGWPEPKSRPPVLVPEGFALWAFVFGAFWYLVHRLWWEALALFLPTLAVVLLLPDPAAGIALVALHLIAGFEARDRQRARLARQGLVELGVIAAPDMELAWFRLAQRRPELVKAMP
jgi:hypothetical protein